MAATSPYFSKKRKLSEPEPLEDLLQIPAETPSLQEYFRTLAETLLNKVELVVRAQGKTKRSRILELEIYFQSASHADPFCHAREIQAHPALWHFHRSGNATTTLAGGYRGGTRKGLDVTFGNEQARAGILLRSLQAEDGTVICGPSKLVDTILSINEVENIRTLVELYSDISILPSSLARENDLYLSLTSSANEQIYASPRIGLDLSRASDSSDPRVEYINKPYRFFVKPELLKAGRPQTFLGLYHSGLAEEEIVSKGFSKKIVKQYMEAFESGKVTGLDQYLGKKGSLSPTNWLRMAGALEATREQL